ncbi:MAG: hypothetical protein JWN04_3 [Myxococcaceae bacterium]|nr:hypothetical protein [Myxococcaceae bacterium]
MGFRCACASASLVCRHVALRLSDELELDRRDEPSCYGRLRSAATVVTGHVNARRRVEWRTL